MKFITSILVFALFVTFSACKKNETNSNSPSTPNAVSGTTTPDGQATATPAAAVNEATQPVGPTTTLELDKTEYDFGKVKEGEVVKTTITVKNTGSEPLIITDCHASCGCTTPTCDKNPIAPGQTGKVEVSFDSMGRAGNINKTVTITANTNPTQTIFTLKGKVDKAK